MSPSIPPWACVGRSHHGLPGRRSRAKRSLSGGRKSSPMARSLHNTTDTMNRQERLRVVGARTGPTARSWGSTYGSMGTARPSRSGEIGFVCSGWAGASGRTPHGVTIREARTKRSQFAEGAMEHNSGESKGLGLGAARKAGGRKSPLECDDRCWCRIDKSETTRRQKVPYNVVAFKENCYNRPPAKMSEAGSIGVDDGSDTRLLSQRLDTDRL